MPAPTQLATPTYRQNPQQQKPVPPRSKKWQPWLIIGGMLAFGAVLTVCMLATLGIIYFSQDRIASGVSVAGVDVSGKALDNAAEAVQQGFANGTVTLTDGDRKWLLSLAELGVSIDMDATKTLLENAEPDAQLQPVLDINLNTTQEALINLSALVNIEPTADGQMGRAVEIPVTLDRLRTNLAGELADNVLELDMIEVEPPVEEIVETAYTGESTTHIVEPGQELGLIAKEYNVSTQDVIALNNITDPDLIYVGQELLIPAGGVYAPTAADAPAPPTTAGKSIVVSTQTQRIYAYENGQLVRSHLVSTGRDQTPTVLGDYAIYVKHEATDMHGPDYFLPNVPYTMYFYAGYGIHGTYWHNSFGRQMSHGCVNLPTPEAQWFFDWAEVGTPVRVV
ncbi:MAG: L,D-transpeptidase family protein [Anaerolineae bacterium]|nr:L,D-transpeptidase family protein [Anaerolineae bacterium]